jgi:hypothetical protein
MSDIKTIKIKRGLTAGNVPSSLSFGELAVNTFDRTLFVGGITGGVLEYPLQKTYVYNTYSDFVADIDAGVYGTAGNEAHFQYGDLFIERNTSYVYSFLPSTTGATSTGTWGIVSGVSGSTITNYVQTVNGLTGAITLQAGADISIGVSGGNILISYSPEESPLLGSPVVTIRSYQLEGAPSALNGYLWYNTDNGVLYTGYSGDSSVYWVQSASINKNIAY